MKRLGVLAAVALLMGCGGGEDGNHGLPPGYAACVDREMFNTDGDVDAAMSRCL